MDSKDGKWVTINGARVFIKNGQTPAEALKELKQKGDTGSSAKSGSIVPGKGQPHIIKPSNNKLPSIIKLPDEQLPHSLGAMWRNEEIEMPDGTKAKFLEGSKLQDKEVFAGFGTRTPLRDRYSLALAYPGSSPEKWQKVKAMAQIVIGSGEIIDAEIHWYEEPTIGKVEFKCKKEL